MEQKKSYRPLEFTAVTRSDFTSERKLNRTLTITIIIISFSALVKFTIERESRAKVVLDDLNQVAAAVALRTPDLGETVPESGRELCKHSQA